MCTAHAYIVVCTCAYTLASTFIQKHPIRSLHAWRAAETTFEGVEGIQVPVRDLHTH